MVFLLHDDKEEDDVMKYKLRILFSVIEWLPILIVQPSKHLTKRREANNTFAVELGSSTNGIELTQFHFCFRCCVNVYRCQCC